MSSNTWYLMSAFALTEKRACPLSDANVHWGDCTVYIVKSAAGKEMFAVSAGGSLGNINVGYEARMIQDTGNGLRHPTGGNAALIVENVVTYKGGTIASKLNDVGLDSKRPMYCFK
jgi:hypothetical protein